MQQLQQIACSWGLSSLPHCAVLRSALSETPAEFHTGDRQLSTVYNHNWSCVVMFTGCIVNEVTDDSCRRQFQEQNVAVEIIGLMEYKTGNFPIMKQEPDNVCVQTEL